MIIDAGAAPACGSMGAAKVAQMPGQYQTSGTASYGRGFGTYNATTTYVPGPTIVAGSHDRSLGVVMFRNGEPGAENAIDARQALGAEWQDLVKSGVHTCL